MNKHLLKTLVLIPLLWIASLLGAFADVSVEGTYRLKIENVETAVQQKSYTGGSITFRSFYLPAQIEIKEVSAKDSLGNDITKTEVQAIANKTDTAIIIIPDVAQGQLAFDDMKSYLRNLASHLAPLVGNRDIYIFPGRVVEGSYIHHCGLIIQQSWKTEFTDWAQTKQGVKLCLKQLEPFDFDISDFSINDIVDDLAILINNEKLNKPIIWSLGEQYEIANTAARKLGHKLGGLVIDSPYLDNNDTSSSFAEYLQTVDALAQEPKRGWSSENSPSFYLQEMIKSNNKGSVYKGDISDIGFNEDINRLFPVNSDVLNFYMIAKADQPQFLVDLAQGTGKDIYSQFGAFSLENYSSINYLPEIYRSCYKIMERSDISTEDILQESLQREAERQKAICEILNAQVEPEENQQKNDIAQTQLPKIQIPTIVITGRLDPYFSKEAVESWRAEHYENSALFEYIDGSLGTPECSGKPRRDMAMFVQNSLEAEILEDKQVICGWVFNSNQDGASSSMEINSENKAQE